MMNSMKLETARQRFRNRWMVFQIQREKPIVEGQVLGTAKTKAGILQLASQRHLNGVYITFNGNPIPRRMGFLF